MMDPERQTQLRWAVVVLIVALVLVSRAQAQEAHWSDGTAQLEACDLLIPTDGYDAATYCAVRYQAAAAGTWTESAGAEFALGLPVLGVLGVAGLGFAIGSAVFPR